MRYSQQILDTRSMKIRYYIDPETKQPHIFNHGLSEDEVEDVLTGKLGSGHAKGRI